MQTTARYCSGKGSYVKVVGRDGKKGKTMIIVGTIGIQRDKVEAHTLDIRNLTATHVLAETSATEDEGAEDHEVVGHIT